MGVFQFYKTVKYNINIQNHMFINLYYDLMVLIQLRPVQYIRNAVGIKSSRVLTVRRNYPSIINSLFPICETVHAAR